MGVMSDWAAGLYVGAVLVGALSVCIGIERMRAQRDFLVLGHVTPVHEPDAELATAAFFQHRLSKN